MPSYQSPSMPAQSQKCKSSPSRVCKCKETVLEKRLSTGIKKATTAPSPRKLSPSTKASIISNFLSPPQKVYTTKLTSTIILTDAIPCKSKHSGQLIGTILNSSNKPIRVTWDTGAGCSMIERRHLLKNFHPLPKIHNEKSFVLSGVGNFALNQMTQYVSLPIRLVTSTNEIVTFECPKVWIVENYLVDESGGKECGDKEAPVLMGNEFLRNHRLGVEWGVEGTRNWLRYRGREGEFLFPCLEHGESDGT